MDAQRAALTAFNEALDGKTLTVRQIRFIEMIVNHLTASGRMEPELLYAPPFTDSAPNGVSDMFTAADGTIIVSTLEALEPKLEKRA